MFVEKKIDASKHRSIVFLSGQEKKFFSNFPLIPWEVCAFLGPNVGRLDFGT